MEESKCKTTSMGASADPQVNRTGPNIIHNLEENKSVPPHGGRAFDFSQFLLPEELKNNNQNKKLTLD